MRERDTGPSAEVIERQEQMQIGATRQKEWQKKIETHRQERERERCQRDGHTYRGTQTERRTYV